MKVIRSKYLSNMSGFFARRSSLLSLLAIALIMRVINLSYNSPFADEAIYVVIGKLGVFDWDWWTYNAASWLGGSPYAYPLLSALAYTSGGIVWSRLMSVIFGVLSIKCVYHIAYYLRGNNRSARVPAIFSAMIFAFAPVSIYISRLATYDMLAVYFFLMSLLMILKAEQPGNAMGKYYFAAVVSIMLGAAIKLIVFLYVPIICLGSYLRARSIRRFKNVFYWKRYFLIPLIVLVSLFFIINLKPIMTFTTTQLNREYIDVLSILGVVVEELWILWPFIIVGSIGLLKKKNYWLWWGLLGGLMVIVLFHVLLHRAATLNKHMIYPVIFASLIGGIGLSNIINPPKMRYLRVSSWLVLLVFASFGLRGYQISLNHNSDWRNASNLLSHIPSLIKMDDLILSEEGPPVMLALYDINHPVNITTFDWFVYEGMQGKEAYVAAVDDGYFDLIQLADERFAKSSDQRSLHAAIANNIDEVYKPVFDDGDFTVYRRAY